MTKETFLPLVLASVLELKSNATTEEIGNLKFSTLRIDKEDGCILAQMTGERFNSERACELAKKTLSFSRKLYSDHSNRYESIFTDGAIDEVCLEIIVEEKAIYYYYSPFELFIMFENANVEELIKFLKGEIETFEPSF